MDSEYFVSGCLDLAWGHITDVILSFWQCSFLKFVSTVDCEADINKK